ncbi:MAG TPA: fatty acid desaturase [Pirellulales bacterium]|nr:fatty acid desaturase [Pirellulales bacterium]
MLRSADCSTSFSIREAREIVKDLFTPRPAVYWTDFLLSMGVGSLCFRLEHRRAEPFSALQFGLYIVACLAFYRAALFIHELVHLKGDAFRNFRIAWNALCGIPFLMPSFLYYTHMAHHARMHYGTPDDGEYLPLGTGPTRRILKYLTQPFVIPILGVLRFLVFTPLGWISPGFRRFVQQRASSMVMDPGYVRPLPTRRELRYWRWQEAGCFLYAAAVAALFISGRLPLSLLLQGYLTALGIITINHVRTLGAHRFLHRGETMTFVDQLLDSLNYARHPVISALWGPVGLRFHALHHLFPSMPYHALPEAHRRLMAKLPADSPYRQTESPSLFAALRDLWRRAKASQATGDALRGEGVVVSPVGALDDRER